MTARRFRYGDILTALQALEIASHALRSPRRIAGHLGDMIPIAVVRVDQDHRIVGSATAQRCTARIQYTVASRQKLLVASLLDIVFVVADEEVPGEALIFRRPRMKRRHLVVVIFFLATRFEQ